MIPEGTKEAAEVMLAYANGKKIEYRWRGSSNWMEMDSYPVWNWEGYQYRIKPQQTSIPATEEEIKEMNLLGRLVKNKGNGIISILNACNPEAAKHNFYFFNPDTKCWEDWEYEDKTKLNLKLNPDFKKYRPTEEDREEEINEMKDSITGSEGDR